MCGPKWSNDPEQNAEMEAQYYFECRIQGINPFADDYGPEDEPGEDYGPEDEEEDGDYEPEGDDYDDED